MAGQDDGDAPELIDADPGPAVPKRQVPVALITGYLGSGKTTLVRHILRSPHGLRIAVILNEFGEGVENAYFQDIQEDISGLRSSNGDWVELDNGCMCCSVKSEFVLALEALLAKDNKPDYILIETTGLANPGPVAAALWTDEQVEAGVQLDSIITVVDAINIDRQLNAVRAESAVNEAQVQVAYADLILLNKMDLCSDEAIARAEADIRAINSSVHIMHTTNCNVDLHLLLNRQGYKLGTAETILEPIAEDDDNENGDDDDDDDGEGASPGTGADGEPLDLSVVGTRIIPLTQAVVDGISPRVALGGGMETSVSRNSLARSSAASGGGGHSRGTSLSLDPLGDDKPHGSHDPAIQTICLTTDAPLHLDRVKSFLDKLLWDREAHPEDIYRVKGVLHIEGQDNKHMVQAVYELYHITPSAAWLAGERRQSRLVIIGRSLNKPLLEQWFAALAAAQP